MKQDDTHSSIPVNPITDSSRYAFRRYLYFAVCILIVTLLLLIYSRQTMNSQAITATKALDEAFSVSEKYLQGQSALKEKLDNEDNEEIRRMLIEEKEQFEREFLNDIDTLKQKYNSMRKQ